jgi:hypothetical protein
MANNPKKVKDPTGAAGRKRQGRIPQRSAADLAFNVAIR